MQYKITVDCKVVSGLKFHSTHHGHDTEMHSSTLKPQRKREKSQQERRDRVLEAAAELLRKKNYDNVSMIQIAQRANVSEKTVYNLFTSKAAIFGKLIDRDLNEFHRAVLKAGGGEALPTVFGAIEVTVIFFQRDPNLYKAMAQLVFGSDNTIVSSVAPPRQEFWNKQIREAAKAGILLADVDIDLLSSSVANLLTGTFMSWASERISASTYTKICQFGLASLLLPHASNTAREMLMKHTQTPESIK